MRIAANILFWTLYAALLAFAYAMFPVVNVNVLITHIPLIGLAGWLFGRAGGLMIALSLMIFAAALLSFVYADIAEYFAAKGSGSMMYVLAALMTSKLRENHDAIKKTSARLDRMVAARDQQLSALTRRLLDTAETRRVTRGQELHDGIGQQLTGIQLLCSSLMDQLTSEHNTALPLTAELGKRVAITHNLVRRVARLLFPIRIAEVGLSAALTELAASLRDIKHVEIMVKDLGDLSAVSAPVSLQIYRICQETITDLIDNAMARRLEITMRRSASHITLRIAHDGERVADTSVDSVTRLTEYRLKQIAGNVSRATTKEGLSQLAFSIPKPPLATIL